MRILIVDDHEINRMILQKILSPMAECDDAVDGIEGLEAFKEAYASGNPYDLICLDLLMPRMNGYNTLKKIREFEQKEMVPDEKRVRVIVITCVDDGQSKKRIAIHFSN